MGAGVEGWDNVGAGVEGAAQSDTAVRVARVEQADVVMEEAKENFWVIQSSGNT